MIQQQWQIYLNYYQRMEISSPKKSVNRDKCVFHGKTAYVWGLRYRWDPLLSRNLIPRFPHFVPPCDLPTIHIDLLYLNLNLYVYIYLYVYVYIYIFHIDVSLQQPLLYLNLNLYLNSTVHKDLSLPQPPLYLNLNLYIYV